MTVIDQCIKEHDLNEDGKLSLDEYNIATGNNNHNGGGEFKGKTRHRRKHSRRGSKKEKSKDKK